MLFKRPLQFYVSQPIWPQALFLRAQVHFAGTRIQGGASCELYNSVGACDAQTPASSDAS